MMSDEIAHSQFVVYFGKLILWDGVIDKWQPTARWNVVNPIKYGKSSQKSRKKGVNLSDDSTMVRCTL